MGPSNMGICNLHLSDLKRISPILNILYISKFLQCCGLQIRTLHLLKCWTSDAKNGLFNCRTSDSKSGLVSNSGRPVFSKNWIFLERFFCAAFGLLCAALASQLRVMSVLL